MSGYIGTVLKNEIVINKLYTVHYYEYSKEYKFTGERHDFWEFVYVDKGEIIAVAEEREIVLKRGNILFHKPGEWHNIRANGSVASNIAIVSFECNSKGMKFFENKLLSLGQEQKLLISKIITEYTSAFSSVLNDPYTNRLIRKKDGMVGAEQLIKQYLCELLISFLRNNPGTKQQTLTNINYENSVVNLIVNYMSGKISKSVNLDELVSISGTNKTTINAMFKKNFNVGAIEYFFYMKTELAKKYLREENYNITQIAEILGYSSVHYFSRQFKKITGMSPTEYSNSIKAMMK